MAFGRKRAYPAFVLSGERELRVQVEQHSNRHVLTGQVLTTWTM